VWDGPIPTARRVEVACAERERGDPTLSEMRVLLAGRGFPRAAAEAAMRRYAADFNTGCGSCLRDALDDLGRGPQPVVWGSRTAAALRCLAAEFGGSEQYLSPAEEYLAAVLAGVAAALLTAPLVYG
jgi:hypothetical protein